MRPGSVQQHLTASLCTVDRGSAFPNLLFFLVYAYYRKRGSASYIVREVHSVRERERERERYSRGVTGHICSGCATDTEGRIFGRICSNECMGRISLRRGNVAWSTFSSRWPSRGMFCFPKKHNVVLQWLQFLIIHSLLHLSSTL